METHFRETLIEIHIFVEENAFYNVVCNMSALSSGFQFHEITPKTQSAKMHEVGRYFHNTLARKHIIVGGPDRPLVNHPNNYTSLYFLGSLWCLKYGIDK